MPAHSHPTNPTRAHSRSRKVLLAFIASLAAAPSSTASACCLTDWLYGRQPAYAIAEPIPVTTGQAVSPYAAGYAPYTAGYTPLLTPAPNSTVLPLAGSSIYSPSPYAVQRPAYGAVPLDNPSVYTGLPVASGYRGVATAGKSFYGTGNVYPNNYASATPTVGAAPVTSYRADMGSSVALPIVQTPATPVRSGLSRFFGSLLGTGYRTSYYNAPITYYRPVTSIDPVSGTTVTVQQPCASTLQQVQRTPYTTLQHTPLAGTPLPSGTPCGVDPTSGIDPCSALSAYDPATGSGVQYGAAPIPSAVPQGGISSIGSYDPNGSSYSYGNVAPTGGYSGASDAQPLAPPTLPLNSTGSAPSYSDSAPTYSGRPSYIESDLQTPRSNLSPLTGSPPSYRQEFESDRAPLQAPELRSARPAMPDSEASDEAYRQGYEAGRAALRAEAERAAAADAPEDNGYTPFTAPENSAQERENSGRERAAPDAPSTQPNGSGGDSYYRLNPPTNSTPSTEESHQRSRFEIERDQRDLRELTTGLSRNQGENRYVNNSSDAAPRVRPIPAPENYRNPFETKEPLNAPDLLPALPRPSVQLNRGVDRSSGYSGQTEQRGQQQRLSVPVREASIQGAQDRVLSQATQRSQRTAITPDSSPQPAAANAWQQRLRQQSQDSGWYAKDR